ncbi:tyrosine-protein phosphatase [Phenylobacterium sp.]|uniref:tyrosine-protein phosphatase n=1 Tax=Phenylobacterium sp. TaxID=1871053 RepID=UPI0035AF964D
MLRRLLFLLPAALVLGAAGAPAPAVETAQATLHDGAYEVTWTSSRAGAPVDVFVAARPDAPARELKRLADDDRDGRASFKNPLGAGRRPYFFVRPDASRAGLWTAVRVLPLEGATNFRDIGGYATADGRHVRWGLLYRSNALDGLTAADYKIVSGLGVRLVCDLRTDQEREEAPTRWQGAPPEFLNSPKAALDTNMSALFAGGPPTAATVRANFIKFYADMPEAYAGEYKAMFRRLIDGEAPMIMHCTAGKDRTGVGSALLLTALGVPRATVVEDYSKSAALLARQPPKQSSRYDAMFAKLPPDVIQALMGSDPAYVESALDAVDARYGSVEGYLAKELGVTAQDLAKLRARYLE